MTVLKHNIRNFRNIREISFEPEAGINLLFGQNGQGKTNILESIWLFTGCHSFRTKKNQELIREGETVAATNLSFYSAMRTQSAAMRIHQTREVELNGIAKKSPRQLLGEIQAVIFSPEVLSIVKEGPAQRRRFLDVAISQTQSNYAYTLTQYNRALQQRNNMLRAVALDKEHAGSLETWEVLLAKHGAALIAYRKKYIDSLSKCCAGIYGGISGGKEQLTLQYESEAEQGFEETEKVLCIKFRESRKTDIRRQYTTVGVHKEDISLMIDRLPARSYASQGQQRCCALALKIGEAQLLHEASNEKPTVLLDDVMSELDEQRQKDVLRYLEDWQVFVTCCEPSRILREKIGKAFEIQGGTIIRG